MARIVTLTLNPALDKSSSVEHVVPEKKLRCEEAECYPGGGGLNVARAISQLGGSVTAYWTCGGVIGELLRQLLDQEGIDHIPLSIEEMTRENLIFLERSSGQQYRFCLPGARLTNKEVNDCIQTLQELDPVPEYLVLSGSLPPGVEDDLYARIAAAMPSACRVIIDTHGPPLRKSLRASPYLIKPNIAELEQIVGRSIENDAQIEEASRSLLEQGHVEVVVTSLGSGGAIVTTTKEFRHIRAPTVKIRSKVGAGDSMVGGMVLALSRGEPVLQAARFGVAAGAAAVMTEGTTLCRREDTERLFQEMVQLI